MNSVSGFRLSPQQAQAQKHKQVPVELHWQVTQDEAAQALDPHTLARRLEQLAQDEELLRTRLATLPGLSEPVQVVEDQAAVAVFHQNHVLVHAEAPVLTLHIDTAAAATQLRFVAAPTHFDRSSLRLLASWLLSDESNPQRLQYADYAEWKWQITEEDDATEARSYWREAREKTRGFRGLLLENTAPGSGFGYRPLAQLPHELLSVAERQGIAPEILLLAAWGALLARHSGQGEVALTWMDAGRGEGLELGLGIYELALPLNLSYDINRDLAAQTAAVDIACARAINWRDYCVEPGSCAYAFEYHRCDLPPRVRETWANGHNHLFALKLEVEDRHGRLIFDQARFTQAAVDCIAEQWTLLLEALLRTPAQALGALPLTGPVQHALIQANSPQAAVEAGSVVDFIRRSTVLHPEATAVKDSSGALSYAQLDALSDRLAARMQKNGVAPGVVVAIVLPRRREALVAILAVLKAGGAYVPVDPAYPAERRAYMLKDSGARHLIHDTSVQALPAVEHRYNLDVALADASAAPFSPVAIDPASTAYLIYTSGSTGQPKAVVISHASLSYSTQMRTACYHEVVHAYLLLSSFSFDSSVAGIFWTLTQGGCLVLPAAGDELALDRLGRLIETERISHGLCVPSLYQALLDETPAERLHTLRAWIVAGETCPDTLPAQHLAKLPHAGLFNEYGPTEATVWASVERLEPGRTVGIGRPLPGMQLDLVNERGLAVGIGEIGEIVLSGPGLAIGYWNRPEATAQAFAPLTSTGRARAYRTGDLAFRDAEGRLLFVGRKDHQVKIRGYRIELGEIERCLRTHADVREAAVVVQERGSGKRLVAYILARHGYAPANGAMLDYLGQYLPAHMLPAAVVTLDAFPRTPNGKLDSKALPDPDSLRRAPVVAPRTPTEIALARIIAGVLKLPAISVNDSFLEIGGDSILSLQVVARARELGLLISTRQIFDLQTVARLAEAAGANVTELTTPAPTTSTTASLLDDDELAALADELADLEPNA